MGMVDGGQGGALGEGRGDQGAHQEGQRHGRGEECMKGQSWWLC